MVIDKLGLLIISVIERTQISLKCFDWYKNLAYYTDPKTFGVLYGFKVGPLTKTKFKPNSSNFPWLLISMKNIFKTVFRWIGIDELITIKSKYCPRLFWLIQKLQRIIWIQKPLLIKWIQCSYTYKEKIQAQFKQISMGIHNLALHLHIEIIFW